MDHKAFLAWKARLAELSPDQIKKLRQAMQALKMIGRVPNEARVEDDWLLQGIVLWLKQQGKMDAAGYYALVRSKSYKVYKDTAHLVREDLDKLLPVADRAAARNVVVGLVCNALAARLERARIKVTPGTLLSSTSHALLALDTSFPGYISAACFHVVITGKLEND